MVILLSIRDHKKSPPELGVGTRVRSPGRDSCVHKCCVNKYIHHAYHIKNQTDRGRNPTNGLSRDQKGLAAHRRISGRRKPIYIPPYSSTLPDKLGATRCLYLNFYRGRHLPQSANVMQVSMMPSRAGGKTGPLVHLVYLKAAGGIRRGRWT